MCSPSHRIIVLFVDDRKSSYSVVKTIALAASVRCELDEKFRNIHLRLLLECFVAG